MRHSRLAVEGNDIKIDSPSIDKWNCLSAASHGCADWGSQGGHERNPATRALPFLWTGFSKATGIGCQRHHMQLMVSDVTDMRYLANLQKVDTDLINEVVWIELEMFWIT